MGGAAGKIAAGCSCRESFAAHGPHLTDLAARVMLFTPTRTLCHQALATRNYGDLTKKVPSPRSALVLPSPKMASRRSSRPIWRDRRVKAVATSFINSRGWSLPFSGCGCRI